MDEKYPDNGAPHLARITSLTGVLVSAEEHNVFRERFYSLVFDVLGRKKGVVLAPPEIHASKLLPELGDNDEARFGFLREMIQLVNELDHRIYRIGYYSTKNLRRMCPDEKSVVGLCFMSMLFCLQTELISSTVWPVMETDQSNKQDQSFAGLGQYIDAITAQLGQCAASIDNENLGEVLYATKRSAHTSVVDCVAYLLHLAFLKSIKQKQTPFKSRLAEIATGLNPAIVIDEVIEMKFERSPPNYVANGPIRFCCKIE